MNITNAKLCFVHMPTNLSKLINQNHILQIISKIARNIFMYLDKNQNVIRTCIWSYLILEVSVSAASVISIGNRYNLESCRNIVCNHWNSVENRHFFSNTVQFRCNSSHLNYHPFYFLKECMIDLCNYGKNIDINWYHCSNFNEKLEGVFSTKQLWNSICRKKPFRHNDIVKEITYINNCIISFCNYIDIFKIELQQNLHNLCDTIRIEEINEIFFKLSKISQKLNSELEQDNNWTKINVLMSTASSTISSAIIFLKTFSTTIMHQIMETSIEPLNMPFGMSGFHNIITGILQNIQSLRNTHTVKQLVPKNENIGNFFIEVENLITELSNIFNPTLPYSPYDHIGHDRYISIDPDSKLGVVSSDVLLKASLQGRHIGDPQLQKILCDSEKLN